MKREYFAGAITLAGMALSGAALAQTAAPATGEFTLEEVVVTAERREENLQKVAATVTAISQDTLQEQGVRDITDITRVAPQIIVQQNPVFNNITQRGISTGNYGPVSEGTTAVHLDGAYIARFTGLNGITFDTQRVEVVDGPQGTLYGRNATAGTINFISNRPGDTFGGNGSIEVGNYNVLNVQAAVNLPISDTLKTRVAIYHNAGDGYYSNGEVDSRIDSFRASALWKPTENDQLVVSFTGVRVGGKGGVGGSSVYDYFIKKPTLVQQTAGANAGQVSFPTPATANGPIPCPTTTCNVYTFEPAWQEDPWDNKPFQGWETRGRLDTRNNALIAQYEHRFNFATLSASASLQDTSTDTTGGYAQGYTGSSDRPELNAMLWSAGWNRANVSPSKQYYESEWKSFEMHLSSNGDGQLKWMGGVYHFEEDGGKQSGASVGYVACFPYGTTINACPPSPLLPYTTVPSVANGYQSGYGQRIVTKDIYGQPVVNSNINWEDGSTTTDANAVFGQATWTPTFLSRAHLTLGARYNTEDRAGRGAIVANRVINPLLAWDDEVSFSKTTYKVNLAFDITDRNLVYVDRSTGFKSGGIGYGPTPKFYPEQMEAWEVGLKNRFFNDRLQVNFAAWYYDFTNRQVQGNDYVYDYADVLDQTADQDPIGSLGQGSVINAGTSVSKGQSLDLTWVITGSDRVGMNVQHVESFYTNYDLTTRQIELHQNAWCTATPDGSTPAGGCVGDDYYNPAAQNPAIPNTVARVLNLVPSGTSPVLTGSRINNTRPWSGNASYSHTFNLASASLEATLSVQYQGSVDKLGAVNTNAYLIEQPAYHSEDVTLRYRPNDSNWDVLLYARNFLDREIKTNIGFTSNATGVANYLDPNAVARANYAYWTATYGPPLTYGAAFNYRF